MWIWHDLDALWHCFIRPASKCWVIWKWVSTLNPCNSVTICVGTVHENSQGKFDQVFRVVIGMAYRPMTGVFSAGQKNGREKAKVEKRIYGIHKNPTPWVRFLTKLRNSGFVIPWCLNLRLSPHHRKSFNGLSMVTYNYGPRVKHRC